MPSSGGKKGRSSAGKRKAVSRYVIVGIIVVVGLVAAGILAPRMGKKQQAVVSAVELPAWLQGYPPEVREAYEYAATHQDVLDYMACYCGCENHGHDSNASCYVKDIGPDGKIEWDSHAAT